jgi:hypothetical protein
MFVFHNIYFLMQFNILQSRGITFQSIAYAYQSKTLVLSRSKILLFIFCFFLIQVLKFASERCQVEINTHLNRVCKIE